jgi:hypothetical protein
VARLVDVGAREIDLVEDRDHGQVVLEREIDVRHRLRLDALRGVHDQQRAFAGGEASRDLVGEVDVPRRVDQLELVLEPVVGRVLEADRLRLDGDPALALEVHLVQELRLHLALGERARELEQAIGQRALAVVDVRDDREIADARGVGGHNGATSLALLAGGVERQLAGHAVLVLLQHEVDPLPDVHGNRHLGAIVQGLELLVLLRGDVDGRADLLAGHGKRA